MLSSSDDTMGIGEDVMTYKPSTSSLSKTFKALIEEVS